MQGRLSIPTNAKKGRINGVKQSFKNKEAIEDNQFINMNAFHKQDLNAKTDMKRALRLARYVEKDKSLRQN